MGLFKKKEKRSEGDASSGGTLLSALIRGKNSVTREQAMQIPTFAACISIIAECISSLPIKLYHESGKKVEEITNDRILDLLNHDTGDTLNACSMRKRWIYDYYLGKGAYTYIDRNMYNEPIGLYYVNEKHISVLTNVDPIFKNYCINVNGKQYFSFEFLKILRNSEGLGTGRSIIDDNSLILAISYNTMMFENSNIRKGGNKRGYIKAQSKLSRDAIDDLKSAWKRLYSNSDREEDNIVLLNDGVDFKEASSTSVELQLNENKLTNAAEICKLFCMPAAILNGKADAETMSQFVQNCLMGPINTIETALDTDLLTEKQKAEHYYYAFDTSELTRGDFLKRMNGYAVALQENIYQLDEIREKEDLPPLNFNFIKLGLDAVLLDPKTKEIYTPNTGRLEKINGEKLLTDEENRAIIENRYNENHDPESGRFTSGSSKMSAPGQKPPDFDKYPVKEDLTSVESVKRQMIEQLGIAERDIDLTGIKNAEVLQPFADRLKIIKDETGMKFPAISSTEMFNGDPNCIAAFSRGENTLYISSKFFNSKEATVDTLRDWADKRIIPPQAKTIEFLAEHEAAHIRIPEQVISKDAAYKIWRKRSLSNKNDDNIFEFFADSVAIYRIGKGANNSNIDKAVNYLKSEGVII